MSGVHPLRRIIAGGWLALMLAALVLLAPSMVQAADVDGTITDAVDGKVPGVTAVVRGSGLGYYGDSLRIHFTNDTGREIRIRVPLGTQFHPANEAVQTMIAAGGETIVVPPGAAEADIKAFCGEMHDSAPSVDDVFTPGAVVVGDLYDTIKETNRLRRFDQNGQAATWSWTDGLDVSNNPEAAELTKGGGISATEAAVAGAVVAAGAAGGAIVVARGAGSGPTSAPPVAGSGRVLSGTAARDWLMKDGAKTITHNGTTYVVPPDNLPPNTDGIAYETKTVDGVEVIDTDHLAVSPHHDDVEPAPAPSATSTSPAPPAPSVAVAAGTTTPPAPTAPGEVRISQEEQQSIFDWGMKHNRPISDIQEDLDARNQTAGGSGQVPLDNVAVRIKTPQGDVWASKQEAADHAKAKKEHERFMDYYQIARRDWKKSMIRQQIWTDHQSTVGWRWLQGAYDVLCLRNRMRDPGAYVAKQNGYRTVEELLVQKYGKPTWTSYDTRKHANLTAAVRAWETTEPSIQFHRDSRKVYTDSYRALRSIPSDNPEGATWLDRPRARLQKIAKQQDELITYAKTAQEQRRRLREMEARWRERM